MNSYDNKSKTLKRLSTPARLCLITAASLAVMLGVAWSSDRAKSDRIEHLSDSWVLKENRNGPVIGDLGGVPVSIPRPYANLVEYDGDPHFMEKRKEPAPKRTHQSKLASFGFEVRFPDMAPVTDETAAEKRKENIHTTMWMLVEINSHSAYGGAGDFLLDRKASAVMAHNAHPYVYKPLPDKVHGLTGFAPIGPDESKRLQQAGGADMNDVNIYFHRNEAGQVDTYIDCSNMAHAAAGCRQVFNLQPQMRIRVTVSYRRDLLPHWQEIQNSVSKAILGFRVAQTNATTSNE
jgi:hypothetical protein